MKIAILGYGIEGESLIKYFRTRDAQITLFYYTNKSAHASAPINRLPKAIEAINVGSLDGFAGLDFKGYDRVYRTSNILPTKLKVGTQLSSSTQEFFDHCPAPIIGITGTKGKGTTSSLIARILETAGHKAWLVGNIGTPPLDVLPKIVPEDYVIFELSSFQLQDLTKSPHIAVMLMVVEDHLDTHADMDEYVTAKKQIFAQQKSSDIAVYCDDNEIVRSAVQFSRAEARLPFSNRVYLPGGVSLREGWIWYCAEPVVALEDVPLLGIHNLQNVAAAIAATWEIVQDKKIIAGAIKGFKPLPHRLELIATRRGVHYIDDSISTNPSTAIAAIHSLDAAKVLLLGGSNKGHDFNELAAAVKKGNVRHVVLLGELADKIAKSLVQANFHQFVRASDMAEAVRLAATKAQSGDIVLLSPACASFDMFSGYAARGESFAAAVKKL